MNMNLRNPFAIRDNKVVMIEDKGSISGWGDCFIYERRIGGEGKD